MKQTSTKTVSNHPGSFFSIAAFNQSEARKHRHTSAVIKECLSNEISSLFSSSNCLLILDSNSCFLLRFLQSSCFSRTCFSSNGNCTFIIPHLWSLLSARFLSFSALVKIQNSRREKGEKRNGEISSTCSGPWRTLFEEQVSADLFSASNFKHLFRRL